MASSKRSRTSPSENLPAFPSEWKRAIAKYNLHDTSIHDGTDHDSASKITMEQFLLLRVVNTDLKQANDFNSSPSYKWLDKQCLHESINMLNQNQSFQNYLEDIDRRPPSSFDLDPQLDIGSFSLVRLYQMACDRTSLETVFAMESKTNFSPVMTRKQKQALAKADPVTPSKAPATAQQDNPQPDYYSTPDSERDAETPADSVARNLERLYLTPHSPATGELVHLQEIEDEQIVNTALVLFLNAITMFFQTKGRWSLSRKAFTVRSYEVGQSYKVYEARVDGILQRIEDSKHKALSIVEVKPVARMLLDNYDRIRMQEAAQMAAWISDDPPQSNETGEYTRVLISQDRHEIYLNFAHFTDAYVEYIRGEKHVLSSSRAFGASCLLSMSEYGPFVVSRSDHMRVLSYYLLALTRQQCA